MHTLLIRIVLHEPCILYNVTQKETLFSQSNAPSTLSSSIPAQEIMETEETVADMESTFNVSDFTSPVLNTPEAPQFSPVTPSPLTPDQVFTPVSPPTSNQHIPPHTSTPAAPVTPSTTQESTGQRDKKSSTKHGVKIVGDNIDKNVRPRHQTMEKQTQSLHYFNCFACLDRVDLSGLSDNAHTLLIRIVLHEPCILYNVTQKETLFSQSNAPSTLSSSIPAQEIMETEETVADMESTFNVSDFTSPVLNTPEAPQP